MEGHCTGERSLSFGARPWCDVRAVAFNTQPAFAWHTRAIATALVVTREVAKYARLPHAHSVLRWL